MNGQQHPFVDWRWGAERGTWKGSIRNIGGACSSGFRWLIQSGAAGKISSSSTCLRSAMGVVTARWESVRGASPSL
jgi:hypothetical protein